MDGFFPNINAHNHIYSAFARGLSIKGNNPTTFLEVLDQLWWTIDRNLTLPDTKASADATCTTNSSLHAFLGACFQDIDNQVLVVVDLG